MNMQEAFTEDGEPDFLLKFDVLELQVDVLSHGRTHKIQRKTTLCTSPCWVNYGELLQYLKS